MVRPLGWRRLLGGGECRAGDRQYGGAGNKCFPHGNLQEFRRRVQSKTSRSRTQVKLWSRGATIHKSEQPCTSAGTRALVRSSLCRDQAPPSDRLQGTRNMGITSLASIDLHTSAQERSRLFAVSGVRLLLSSCGSKLRPNHH